MNPDYESTSTSALHLECKERVKKLPLVEAALAQSSEVYNKVKDSHEMVHWTLSAAESAVRSAVEQATPLVKKLENHIHIIDQTLCKGLDAVEDRLPIVKEQPQQIYEAAKAYIAPACSTINTVTEYGAHQVKSLVELSLNKANDLMVTYYSQVASTATASTAVMSQMSLPLMEDESDEDEDVTNNAQVTPTLHNVRKMYLKIIRHMYLATARFIKNMDEGTVQNMVMYIQVLGEAIKVTKFLELVKRRTGGT